MKRIYLTGYKKQNLGDDLFFITVLNRYPDVHFLFEDVSSGYYAELFKDFKNIEVLPCIPDSFLGRIMKKICQSVNSYWEGQYNTNYQKKHKIKADAYLKIGGSIFIEPRKNLKAIKKRFISEKKYFGEIPFFYIGCNFGPYTSPVFFKSAEYVIQQCNAICFRDSYSYNLFKQFEHVRLASDVLFGIKSIFRCSQKKTKTLGLSLINLSCRPLLAKFYQSYLDSISTFVKKNNKNYELIKLFSFCEPEGDGQAIKDLIDLLPEECNNKIEVITYNGDYRYFLQHFCEVELLISTRFHAMVLGLVYDIKTVPIIYSNKILEVLNDIKCDNPIVSLEKLCFESLSEAALRTDVVNVEAQAINCQRQFDDLDLFLNKPL